MSQVTSSAERVVAVLHDVIEDTNYTVDTLRHLGYSERVLDALDRLTHRDGEAYETSIERIKDDLIAVDPRVKTPTRLVLR
jgi:(p)ppGpp synthase/HD superfamily hydrolase